MDIKNKFYIQDENIMVYLICNYIIYPCVVVVVYHVTIVAIGHGSLMKFWPLCFLVEAIHELALFSYRSSVLI